MKTLRRLGPWIFLGFAFLWMLRGETTNSLVCVAIGSIYATRSDRP